MYTYFLLQFPPLRVVVIITVVVLVLSFKICVLYFICRYFYTIFQ